MISGERLRIWKRVFKRERKEIEEKYLLTVRNFDDGTDTAGDTGTYV